MSQRQDRRVRREVSKFLRDAGATPAEIQKQWDLTVKPRPWWVPSVVWGWLLWFVLKKPPGLKGEAMRIDDGTFHRHPVGDSRRVDAGGAGA